MSRHTSVCSPHVTGRHLGQTRPQRLTEDNTRSVMTNVRRGERGRKGGEEGVGMGGRGGWVGGGVIGGRGVG
jgi:hypothetical protein